MVSSFKEGKITIIRKVVNMKYQLQKLVDNYNGVKTWKNLNLVSEDLQALKELCVNGYTTYRIVEKDTGKVVYEAE